jgi:hypothetical protein
VSLESPWNVRSPPFSTTLVDVHKREICYTTASIVGRVNRAQATRAAFRATWS